jgi:mRNA interferase MazF
MEAGQIIVAELPQADGKRKPRPALLLKRMPGRGDWLVCGISTQLYEYIKGFDVLLDAHHPDYAESGLLDASVIRLGYLTVLPSGQIKGAIGAVGESTYRLLISNLTAYLAA